MRSTLGIPGLMVLGLLVAAPASAQLVISEFRLRGPSGANDEYVEIMNNSASPHTVAATSGTGYALAASDGITRSGSSKRAPSGSPSCWRRYRSEPER